MTHSPGGPTLTRAALSTSRVGRSYASRLTTCMEAPSAAASERWPPPRPTRAQDGRAQAAPHRTEPCCPACGPVWQHDGSPPEGPGCSTCCHGRPRAFPGRGQAIRRAGCLTKLPPGPMLHWLVPSASEPGPSLLQAGRRPPGDRQPLPSSQLRPFP